MNFSTDGSTLSRCLGKQVEIPSDMRVFEEIVALRDFLDSARQSGKTVGLVPTMGALHDGHAILMKQARVECDVVVVSIFVNPTQFGPSEDYHRYPRDLARDTKLAQQANVDAVFVPTVVEIYPTGSETLVDAPKIASMWEGEFRPGHFQGVATVCTKLYNIAMPHRMYFGMKDYQQLKVIERVMADLLIPTKVVPVATVREPDGLAMSSRNAYLSLDERQAALCLSRGLCFASDKFQSGERNAEFLTTEIVRIIQSEPSVQLQYAAIANAKTLEPIKRIDEAAVALVAATVGKTRLIDNMVLQSE